MEYFIPHDSSELLKKNGLKAKDIDNFSLRFNRFTQRDYNDTKDKYEFNLRDVNFSFDRQIDKVEKQQSVIKNLYVECESMEVQNSWRLAIGIGSASVYETSITLHHIYGLPFIPAQSIKGSLRSYIIHKYFEKELFSEKYKDKYSKFEDEVLYKTPWFVEIFGSNDKQGKVIFFDAFTKESEIKVDIMNNHYQKYYNGSEAPTDTQNPNPVNFMTLKNAKFQITIATKENIKINEGLFKDEDILALVKKELSNALEVFGIGAKTAVGYGYFEVIKSQEELKAEREAIEKKREQAIADKLKLEKQQLEEKKAKNSEGIFKLESCTDLDMGLKIIKDSLGKKAKPTIEQKELIKNFYEKNEKNKKYKKGTYKKYEELI